MCTGTGFAYFTGSKWDIMCHTGRKTEVLS